MLSNRDYGRLRWIFLVYNFFSEKVTENHACEYHASREKMPHGHPISDDIPYLWIWCAEKFYQKTEYTISPKKPYPKLPRILDVIFLPIEYSSENNPLKECLEEWSRKIWYTVNYVCSKSCISWYPKEFPIDIISYSP